MSTEHTEAKDDQTSTDLVRDLLTAVTALTGVVSVLSDRFRRKRISDGVLAVLVAVLTAFVLLYYFVELPDRRQAIRDQAADSEARSQAEIRNLACYAVRLRAPGYSPTSDALRAKYRCPAYDPSQVGPATGAPTSSSPTGTTPATGGGGSQRPSAAQTPAAATGAGSTVRRTPAARTSSPRAAAAPTPTRSVATTGGRDASPSSTPLIQLPLCSLRVAGIGLCRSS